MKLPEFDYYLAESWDDLFDVLERYGDEAEILAGGQSLMPALAGRLSAPRAVVDINGLSGLGEIDVSEGVLRIGALVRHVEVERSQLLAKSVPLLPRAMRHVAHAAIRNRGTFGGSIALADPAAEIPACSLLLDGRFSLVSRSGTRVVKAEDFFFDLYETAREQNEVLAVSEFDLPEPDRRFSFAELSRRHGDYAMLGMAASARVKGTGLRDVRVSLLSAGTTPVLARLAASELEGPELDTERIRKAKLALTAELDPPEDALISTQVKLQMAQVLLERAANELRAPERTNENRHV